MIDEETMKRDFNEWLEAYMAVTGNSYLEVQNKILRVVMGGVEVQQDSKLNRKICDKLMERY